MLEILGVGVDEETVYMTLLDNMPLTVRQLARACGSHPYLDVEAVLESLEVKGLVHRLPGDLSRFAPTAPEVALEALQLAREEEVRKSRAAITDLTDRYLKIPRRTDEADAVAMVVGGAVAGYRLDQEMRSAKSECRVFDCPPYQLMSCGMPDAEREMLANGVRVRAVYDHEAMDQLNVEQVRLAIGLGEEARLATGLRLRMFLIDDRIGLIPMKAGQSPFDGMLVIRRSAVLDALSELFEVTWKRALPLMPYARPGESDGHLRDADEDRLLGLLAAGLGDAAIARQLGLSLRTVERRISRIMTRLNVKTRFQAGVVLGRDGYYDDGSAHNAA